MLTEIPDQVLGGPTPRVLLMLAVRPTPCRPPDDQTPWDAPGKAKVLWGDAVVTLQETHNIQARTIEIRPCSVHQLSR